MNSPKKHLGQNFLVDPRIRQKILQTCGFKPQDIVVEIGPGQGALTWLIAPGVRKLICVEKDHDLIEPLKLSSPNAAACPRMSGVGDPVQIIHGDFLIWDMGHLAAGLKVVGNIPYYISTPIIEKLLENRHKIAEAFLTVQLEFGERLTAKPGGKDYGSLSCFVQYYADAHMLFKIKKTCFKPVPKVDSCFVHLIMRPPKEKADNERALFKMIQTAFQQRRKTVVNTLKDLADKANLEEALQSLHIPLNARPETISLSDYIKLSNKLVL